MLTGPVGVVRDGERGLWGGWWGGGGLIEGQDGERGACKTCLGLMRSRCVSRRLMLTAAARWRVREPVCLSWMGRWLGAQREGEMTLDDPGSGCRWVGFTVRARVVADAHATPLTE